MSVIRSSMKGKNINMGFGKSTSFSHTDFEAEGIRLSGNEKVVLTECVVDAKKSFVIDSPLFECHKTKITAPVIEIPDNIINDNCEFIETSADEL